MPDRAHTLDITPEILTLGDKIVAVRLIAAVSGGRTRPFKWAGIALMLVSILMLAYESVLGGGLQAIKSGGSTMIWLALIAAGLGIFGQVFQRRQLVIATGDGGKLRLNAGRDDFVRQVVVRIGEAIRAKPGATLHYVVDLKAETIELRAVVEATAAKVSAPATVAAPHMHPLPQPVNLPLPTPTPMPAAAQGPSFPQPAAMSPNGERHDVPWPNGQTYGPAPGGLAPGGVAMGGSAMGGGAAMIGRQPTQNGWQQAAAGPGPGGAPFAPMHGPPAHGGIGAYAPPNGGYGPVPGNAPPYRNGHSTQPPTGPPGQVRREIDAVVAFVMRSEIQHKQALLDLLNVVEDHFKGGQTSRDDAISNWQSFAGYVEQYLGNVDGLVGITHRAGRSLMHG